MRKLFYLPILFVLSMSLPFFSCSSSDDDIYVSDSVLAIYENVVDAVDIGSEILARCDSPEEAAKYFDGIRKLKGVTGVLSDSRAFYVEIEGWGDIPFMFDLDAPEQSEETQEDFPPPFTRAESGTRGEHEHLAPKRVAIANQMINDKDAAYYQTCAETIEKMFIKSGLDAQPVSPTIDFYETEMYEYDVVFINTHGSLEKDKQHWMLTSDIMPTPKEKALNWIMSFFGKKNKSYPRDEVKLIVHKEQRDAYFKTPIRYAAVSEKFIKNSSTNFRNEGKVLVYLPTCEGLKENDELANAFFARGAAVFVGYDETNNVGGNDAAKEFFGRLLYGVSVKNAIKDMPKKYQNATYEGIKSNIRDLYKEKNRDYCINSLQMTGIENKSTSLKLQYVLTASMPFYLSGIDYPDGMKVGFWISESPELKKGEMITPIYQEDDGAFYEDDKLRIQLTLTDKNLKPETTYFLWPYFFDGTDFCYGEMMPLTTGKVERIDQVVPEEIRKTMEPYIPIYDGKDPPNVEGEYIISPFYLIFDSSSNVDKDISFIDLYIRFYNQDHLRNTLDYEDIEASNGQIVSFSEGKGAFISGDGDYFTVFFDVSNISYFEKYDLEFTEAVLISGKKTQQGIQDVRYALAVTEKSDDPEGYAISPGDFRVFGDRDGLAALSPWSNIFKSKKASVRDRVSTKLSLRHSW